MSEHLLDQDESNMQFLKIAFIFFISLVPLSCVKKPDIISLRFQNAGKDLEILELWQPDVFDHPLTLYDVVEVALTNNLDIYAQEHEKEAQARLANAENLKMLPPLSIEGIQSYRFKPNAAFSQIFTQGDSSSNPNVIPSANRNTVPEISSSQTTSQWTIRESVNLIDLAVSYFRTKQAKAQVLLLFEQHLRARQKLILDIVETYWKAIAAQHAIQETIEMIALSEKYQASFVGQSDKKAISRLQALDFRARLIDQEIQMEAVRLQYHSTKLELAGLMGLLPGTPFELADVDFCIPGEETFDLKELENLALNMRPELVIKDLEERIAIEKVRENIALMFPGTSPFTEYNYDHNPFLIYHYWWTVGVRVFWNLFIIPQQWQVKQSVEEQRRFSYLSRLALSVAVITQVHLAYINYRDVSRQFQLSFKAYQTRKELAEIAEKIRRSGEFHGAEVLNFRTDALLAKINAWKTYANMRTAQEQINYAIGRPLYLGFFPQKQD